MITITLLVALAGAPDAPVIDQPRLVMQGEPSPVEGWVISKPETLRRGQKLAECEATLVEAEKNVLLPKPALGALLAVAGAAVLSSISLGIALAMRKSSP